MKILGINFSNDSAAALIKDGVVVAASAQERFTRIKNDAAFPAKAIEYCLKHEHSSLLNMDAVAFFWNPGIVAQASLNRYTSVPRNHLEYLYNVPANLLKLLNNEKVKTLEQTITFDSGKKLTIHFVTHHLCHAASAFYTSSFNEAAILTVDGYGEHQSTGIFIGKGTNIKQVLSVDFPHSIGSFYAAFTQYLGFRPNSAEGKVMGLASYGKTSKYTKLVEDIVTLTDKGFELDLSYFDYFHDRQWRYSDKFKAVFGESRKPETEILQKHMDISFALQATTEKVLLHLCRLAKEKTGLQNLCLAGGVGLNCVANGKIAQQNIFKNCFFYPAAGDAGTSAGAALYVYHNVYAGKRSGAIASEYLGPQYLDDQIKIALDKSSIEYKKVKDVEKVAAQMIADGLIIGWFQGRAEFGPRSLGNRSILANPQIAEMKNILNARVKFREGFRPYAPSVTEEDCGTYFSSNVPSPYMLRAYDTLAGKKNELAAITHVDNTARVQTVSKQQNSRYYKLIKELGNITGIPIVLNTSFNIRGEPIVNTVEDALKCFFTTSLDALFIGEFLIRKK